MKGKIKDSLNYAGLVTISSYDGVKKVKLKQVHNTGNTGLFQFLTACFTGEIEVAQAKRPVKIKLLSIDSSEIITSASSGFIGLLSRPTTSIAATNCSIIYSFLIPRDQLLSLEDLNNLCLGMYSVDAQNSDEDIYNFVAFCKLGGLSQSSVSASSSIVVDWELIIANTTEA